MKLMPFLFAVLMLARVSGAAELWREIWEAESNAKWRAKSQAELTTLAKNGNPIAMIFLAGKLRDADRFEEAKAWDDKAAKAGLPQAVTEQAKSLAKSDINTAMRLLAQAGATGYPVAKQALADVFLSGRVDQKGSIVMADPARTVELLQQAVDENSRAAMVSLARLYACGIGEPRNDRDRPIVLWARAANGGDSEAMKEMARRRRYGIGVEKDVLSAAGWAARARFRFRGWYAPGMSPEPTDWVGRGATADDEALRRISNRYEEALVRHVPAALNELAALHIASEFGAPNLPRAIALYTLAEQRGDTTASAKRKDLEPRLDDEGHKSLQRELQWMNAANNRN